MWRGRKAQVSYDHQRFSRMVVHQPIITMIMIYLICLLIWPYIFGLLFLSSVYLIGFSLEKSNSLAPRCYHRICMKVSQGLVVKRAYQGILPSGRACVLIAKS